MKQFLKTALPVALGVAGILLLTSCAVTIPKGATAVQDFKADKYLGKWYEIARFDYSFEKNLNNATANYSRNDDKSIRVQNRGYNYVKDKWKEATGEARFANSENEARLKVSFFKPFWSGYNVIDIDEEYQYALVVGNNTKYMWILSRKPEIPDAIKTRFLDKAKSLGFKTEELIWVKHDK